MTLKQTIGGLTIIVSSIINSQPTRASFPTQLTEQLQCIADSSTGRVGIAIITDCGDTATVNNHETYPLMSVFKLHQAIAACNYMEHGGISPDSIVTISRKELNPTTWSPMLQHHTGDTITISYKQLIRYALEQSDNNASNYLFENLLNVAATDSFIGGIIPRGDFQLVHSEAEMQQNHTLAFNNCTTPVGAAMLINRLYNGSTPLSASARNFICKSLEECATGTDRIAAPLQQTEGIIIGHKTGSGYSHDGVLAALNDIAFIRLPGGRNYTLAVFVKNFRGSAQEASALIARISSLTYSAIAAYYDSAADTAG